MNIFRRFRRAMPAPAASGNERCGAAAIASIARTHVGKVRRLNEDRALALPGANLWAIADGMGGHEAGDVAAEQVIAALESVAGGGASANVGAVVAALRRVNQALIEARDPAARGREISGATVAALILREGQHHVLWAGDSRVYRRRGTDFAQLSRDHSLVQDLVAAGLLSPAEAARHPQAHVITRAVGVAADIEIEVADGDARPADTYLLCSDGLSDMVGDDELAQALAAPDIAAAADGLIATALSRGAPDNVTCVIVRC